MGLGMRPDLTCPQSVAIKNQRMRCIKAQPDRRTDRQILALCSLGTHYEAMFKAGYFDLHKEFGPQVSVCTTVPWKTA